jgi:hypothetical protein
MHRYTLCTDRHPLSGRRRRRGQARASRANPRDNVGTASLSSVGGHNTNVSRDGGGESLAELLGLLEATLDRRRAERAQAVVGVADVLDGALLALGHLGQVRAALDGVDEDVARLEHGVRRPCAKHVGDAATGGSVVLGVDVEVGDLRS